jgi:hypothetical protein
MITILLVIAVLMLLGVIPAWSHSRSWGYGPSGGVGLVRQQADQSRARHVVDHGRADGRPAGQVPALV